MSIERYVLEIQHNIQNKIGLHASFSDIFQSIIDMVALQLPGALVSVMRLDHQNNTLNLVASNGLSETYIQAAQKIPVGLNVASCGASAFLREAVITKNIEEDANWSFFHEHSRHEGLMSCWSLPILAVDNQLLGTFAIYYRYPRTPEPTEITVITQAAGLLALAIAHKEKQRALQVSEQRFRSLFTQHPDAVYEFDLAGLFLDCNAAMSEMTGLSIEQIKGKHYLDFVVEEDHKRATLGFEQACRGEAQYYELSVYNALGEVRRYEVTNLPIIEEGEIAGVYGIAQDITVKHLQKEQLHLLQRGIDSTPTGVLMADARIADLPIVYSNSAFHDITGYEKEEVIGRNCRFLQGPNTDPKAIEQIRSAIAEQREHRVTVLNYRKDGTPFWNLFSIAPVFGLDGSCTHYIGIQQDVTRQRENEEKLRFKHTHDPLTGLLNWAGFKLELNDKASQRPTVLIVNLDGFKSINDGISHHVGDCLLKAVAERLRKWLPQKAVLARFGSDDFCLLLKNSSEEETTQVAEDLLTLLLRPFTIYEHIVHISASIGISSSENDVPLEAEKYIQHANVAMREAKLQGRNTWHWYRGALRDQIGEHVSLRRDLQEAIEKEQLVLYYQPLVDAVTGKVLSIEALVRWDHPERGLIPPSDFLPLAQQTGQIISIDQWALRQACHDAALINRHRPFPLSVAVNIYPLFFRRSNFFLEVQQALQENELAPQLLELEVTEGLLMSNTSKTIERLQALRDIGIQVAIDDFGTGYSSLSYLSKLPITKVKLDRSFIQGIDHTRDSAAIVQGVITMAHHLGLKVVAEGVETTAEQRDLVHRGCDLLQGFLFSQPVPLQQFMDLPSTFPIERIRGLKDNGKT